MDILGYGVMVIGFIFTGIAVLVSITGLIICIKRKLAKFQKKIKPLG